MSVFKKLISAVACSQILLISVASALSPLPFQITATDSGETWIEIDFNASAHTLQGDDVYSVECYSERFAQTYSAQDYSSDGNITIYNLEPNEKYDCSVMVLDEWPTSSNPFPARKNYYGAVTVYTEYSASIENVEIYYATPSATFLTFDITGPALRTDEKYYIYCWNSSNYAFTAESYDKSGITVSGLSPRVSYTCNAAIRNTRSNTVSNRGGNFTAETIRTSDAAIIEDYRIGDHWVEFEVSNGNLGSNDDYLFRCNEDGTNDYVSALSADTEYTLWNLKSDTAYTCYVMVNRRVDSNAWRTNGKSGEIFVRTEREGGGTNPEGSEFAPYARYEDPPIYDWIGNYKNPFWDTSLGTFEGDAAAELYRRGVIQGYSDGAFGGTSFVNRAEAAKFLVLAYYGEIGSYSASGLFSDVPSGAWYETYVGFAHQQGIINGYPDGTFRPADTINRAEFTKMMVRAFYLQENMDNQFSDVSNDQWFAKYAGAAGRYNFFPTSGHVMSPAQLMTRADVAIAIHQFLMTR